LNNNDYMMMQTNEAAQLLFWKREKSKYLPTVAAFYSHQQLFKVPTFNFTPPDVIGISVDVPIFSSFGRNSRVVQGKYAFEKATIAKNQVAEGLRLSYEQTKSELLTAIAKYKTVKENVDLTKKVYDRTYIKFKSGTASSLELTQAQNQYLTTQSNYFNAIVDMLNSKTTIDKLLNK
jgi:outer membrane protein